VAEKPEIPVRFDLVPSRGPRYTAEVGSDSLLAVSSPRIGHTMRLIVFAAAILICVVPPAQGQDVSSPRQRQPTADTTGLPRYYRLFLTGETLERRGRRSEAAAAFRNAATVAYAEGDTHLAISLVGRGAGVQDPSFISSVTAQLAASPLFEQTRDIEAEAAFVQQTRSTVSSLRLDDSTPLSRTIRSAADAHMVLEDLASGGPVTEIRIRSDRRGMEVRVRRWVSKFQNGPWETVRADTTLRRRIPARYQFCYLNPTTRKAVLIDQPCRVVESCSIALPSAFALPANDNCSSRS
jgi:hypothetical protein